jgi:NDP-sugar pyrophosphorylase family protein
MSTRRTTSSPSWRSRPIRRASPTSRTCARLHGHLCLRDQVPDRAAAPRRRRPESSRDFGKDIIPYIVKHGKAVAHRFERSPACARDFGGEAYWRDVGTIDAYWQANIDLTDIMPPLDIYDKRLADLDLWRDHPAGEVRA